MILRNRFRRFVLMRPDDLGSSGGGAPAPAPAPIEAPAVAAAPVAAPDLGAGAPAVAAPAAPAAPAGPKTMLEAMTVAIQPRDDLGRFTFKDAQGNAVDAQGNKPPAPAAAAPAAPAAPAAEPQPGQDDLLQMPDGLGQAAQQRFKRLVDANKTQEAQLEQASQSLSYVQTQFKEHGVQQPQFEQAMQVVGMINRGDFQGAQRVLVEQLQQLALLSGQPMVPIDPLPAELRQRVDALQLSEQDAYRMAGLQLRQDLTGQATQRLQEERRQQETQQRQQQEQQQAVNAGLLAIDAFCKQMQGSDMDFSVIEEQLIPLIPSLIQDLPPARWAQIVKLQYDTLKSTAGRMRQSMAPRAGVVLHATGNAAPNAAPKDGYEAMWGKPRPAGM